jgi:glycosyltransferase involved in cell wall biosynthesis
MRSQKAQISIGMPVYNGEKYLDQAIASILSQTYADFELIISDNASTDRTREICRHYADHDSRIRYQCNPRNIGAAKNFNLVFKRASGSYFKWMAHDDAIAPEFLSKCLDVLEQNPDVVLCHTRVKIIDTLDHVFGDFDAAPPKVSSPSPQERFGALITQDTVCHEVFGLIRKDALKKTRLIDSYIASDRILRAELGLWGEFYEIPECLFFLRDHAERSIRAMPAHQLRAAWFDPAHAGRKVFPHWRIFIEYLKCIQRVPLARNQRLTCYFHILRWIGTNLNWARMISDLLIAAKPELWKTLFRWVEQHKEPNLSKD